jgi:hypothetical protein
MGVVATATTLGIVFRSPEPLRPFAQERLP